MDIQCVFKLLSFFLFSCAFFFLLLNINCYYCWWRWWPFHVVAGLPGSEMPPRWALAWGDDGVVSPEMGGASSLAVGLTMVGKSNVLD